MPCGFDIARTKSEMKVLSENPKWKQLKAVRKKRVYIADGNQYFNRPGPRLIDSLEILVSIFYPNYKAGALAQAGWITYNE